MKKIILNRRTMVAAVRSAAEYIDGTKENEDKLTARCRKVLDYEPNAKLLDENDKAVQKMQLKLERQKRDARITHGKVDANGVLLKDEKGTLQFTPEALKKANEEIDALEDAYLENVEVMQDEEVEFYVPTEALKEYPTTVPAETLRALEIFISDNTEKK